MENIRKALILAAGEGTRMKDLTKSCPKPLLRILGVPLIKRVLYELQEAGIEEVYIVLGYQGEKIKEELGNRIGKTRTHYLKNPEFKKGNLYSLLSAADVLSESPFLLCMADHLFDPRVIRHLMQYQKTAAVALAVDQRKGTAEDMKVVICNNRVTSIGKDIEEYHGLDIGLFSCSPRIFFYARKAAEEGGTELCEAMDLAAKDGELEAVTIQDIDPYIPKLRRQVPVYWIDIDTQEDIKQAESLLVKSSQKGASDLLARYVHPPVENLLVRHLAPTSITPNQVSFLVNILAYVVAFLLWRGPFLLGAVLTFVVGVIDGVDGKLARVRSQLTKLGSLEHSFDLLYEFTWIVAVAAHAYRKSLEPLPLFLGLFIIVLVSFYRSIYDRFSRTMGKSLDDAGDFERLFRRVAGRRNLYNIWILLGALLSQPQLSLVLICIHSFLTAVIYTWRACRHMREADNAA